MKKKHHTLIKKHATHRNTCKQGCKQDRKVAHAVIRKLLAMASEMQKTLMSLCSDTGWCYAVFWKYKQDMGKVLSWGEGFYAPVEALEMPMESSALSSGTQSSHFHDPIRLALDKMLFNVYSLGEGIIGQVAFTNKYQWIFSSRYKKYPTRWHDQFAAGIKTIAVIAVHQGVVQLGSIQTIYEDLKLVGHVKELFEALQSMERVNVLGAESQREGTYVDPLSTTISKTTIKRMPAISDVWSSLAARGRHLRDEQGLLPPSVNVPSQPSQSRPQIVLDLHGSTSISSSTPSHQPHLHPLSNPLQKCISLHEQAMQPPHSLLYKLGLDGPVQSLSQSLTLSKAAMANTATESVESSSKTEFINCGIPLGVTPSNMAWPPPSIDTEIVYAKSCPSFQNRFISEPARQIEAFSAGGGGASLESSSVSCSRIMAQAHAENMLVPIVESPVLLHHSCVAVDDTLLAEDTCSFSSKCNAQDSLLDVQISDLFNNHVLGELMFSEPQDLSSLKCDNVQHLIGQKQDSCLEVHRSDDVLQRVFSSELDEFDNFIASLTKEQEAQSNGSTNRPSAGTTAPQEDVSKVLDVTCQKASFWDPPMFLGSLQPALGNKQVAPLPVTSSPKLKEETSTSCQTVESDVFRLRRYNKVSKVESIYEESERNTAQGCHMQAMVYSSSMQEEPPKAGKKRARPGENARPRPKDRQQIQDRVHELRSIIPSSAKCSIDALLEKTIKYMTFLQAATEDAGKWKESSLQDDEGNESSNRIESGTSWAVELNGKERSCPLIVEDLSQPQHLLVEMLCEEKGIFLEIANTIRGLGVTIVKGLMELRNKKLWARFVVKADEDVHRVHITWSLIQLLESNTRTSSIDTNLACE